ncbi:hypothetical protein AJ87_07410 [Rhizobium yanglingense]|nr:hypothetical protein AJ87_07410 [Rhizobium yanglingense]
MKGVHQKVCEHARSPISTFIRILIFGRRGEKGKAMIELGRARSLLIVSQYTAMAAIQDDNLVCGPGIASEIQHVR